MTMIECVANRGQEYAVTFDHRSLVVSVEAIIRRGRNSSYKRLIWHTKTGRGMTPTAWCAVHAAVRKEKQMQTTRATTGGLEPRFVIERADGKPINPTRRYSMVLDFSGADPHAIVAAKAYADSIRSANPALATDIEAAIADPSKAPAQHRYAD